MDQLTGRNFQVAETTFRVLGAEVFPAAEVSARYKGILAFKPGLLVAVGFRGTCIPNITGEDGVVRLTSIEINGNVFDRPSTISKALGIEKPMVAYPLQEL